METNVTFLAAAGLQVLTIAVLALFTVGFIRASRNAARDPEVKRVEATTNIIGLIHARVRIDRGDEIPSGTEPPPGNTALLPRQPVPALKKDNSSDG